MKQQKTVIKFLIVVLGMIISWFILYDIWLNAYDDILTVKIAAISGWLLNFIGYEIHVYNSSLIMNEEELVFVGPGCNAMVLMALFTGFIIAFPGSMLKKIFYIPFGILIINFLNVLRVSILALNALYSQQTLDFNHKYTFTIVVYACIFGLWMLWVQKLSVNTSHATSTSAV